MVLKRRINYGGFHDLLAPVVPKAPRSLRKRNFHKKSSESSGICAFELLAAVAGQLLQESESSTSSTNIPKEVNHDPLEVKVKPIKSEHHDQESGVESELVPEPTNLNPNSNELPQSENDSIVTSDFVIKVDKSSRIESFEDKNVVNEYNDTPSKPELGFSNHGNLIDVKFDEIRADPTEKQIGNLSFYRGNNVNINNIRDDDEKYFRYNNHKTKRRVFGSRSRAGYRRMRKMMTSRYWKSGPKMKDYELANSTSGGVMSFYHKRKNICMRERIQTNAAPKRRKLFHHIKDSNNENISKNSVKFSIKSFKVPELYVEVPETATVGSLKRHVMEAVTAILQGKLHVGVLVKGKKVRDDNRTLQQTGISQNCNLENLGFMLEPSLPEASTASLVQKKTPLLLSRSPCPIINPVLSLDPTPTPEVTTLVNHVDKNEESTIFQEEGTTTQEQVADSKALVVVPPLDGELLSMVPLNEKPTKRYELSQRRTRRPFSVSEVEALVEAVETLGAGRWRDVKMRAFDDANHRTYVDLKDKWKTLVHTASIAPQQRRGEPVPQDLLDRVLAAHAYWSQHQSKQQHVKNDKTLGAQV